MKQFSGRLVKNSNFEGEKTEFELVPNGRRYICLSLREDSELSQMIHSSTDVRVYVTVKSVVQNHKQLKIGLDTWLGKCSLSDANSSLFS